MLLNLESLENLAQKVGEDEASRSLYLCFPEPSEWMSQHHRDTPSGKPVFHSASIRRTCAVGTYGTPCHLAQRGVLRLLRISERRADIEAGPGLFELRLLGAALLIRATVTRELVGDDPRTLTRYGNAR